MRWRKRSCYRPTHKIAHSNVDTQKSTICCCDARFRCLFVWLRKSFAMFFSEANHPCSPPAWHSWISEAICGHTLSLYLDNRDARHHRFQFIKNFRLVRTRQIEPVGPNRGIFVCFQFEKKIIKKQLLRRSWPCVRVPFKSIFEINRVVTDFTRNSYTFDAQVLFMITVIIPKFIEE